MLSRRFAGYVEFGRRCIAVLSGEEWPFVFVIICSLLSAFAEGLGISLLVPILDAQGGSSGFANVPLLKQVSQLFEPFSPNERIKLVAVAMASTIILRNVLQYCVETLAVTFPLRLERRLNLRSYETLLSVSLAYIHRRDFGTLQNAVGGWPQRVAMTFSCLALIFSNLVMLGVYIVMMLLLSWRMTLLATTFVLAMSLILRHVTTGALRRAGERLSRAQAAVNHVVMEGLTGMKVVRLAAAEPQILDRYRRASGEAIFFYRQLARIQSLSAPLLSTSAGLFICLLLFVGAVIHAGEAATWVSSMLLLLLLLFRLIGPVSNINVARNRIISYMPDFEALTAFYDETTRQMTKSGSVLAPALRQRLVLERVGFAYEAGEPAVLSDVSTTIESGKMVAIVGPSGAGKSTLIMLVARLYDPQRGRILVDGVDLRDLDLRSWRKRIAVVTQDTVIFNDTVANNISFGRESVAMDRIRTAAEFAAAAEFIEDLPQGYETMLGDRGVRLSGGQQQRIAIARAVLADPALVMFDEATSSLDTFTERAIQKSMEKLSATRTVLVVAHRLSTIRKADKVIVVENGHIVEEGTHRELFARRGRFWEMVEHQRLDLVAEDAEQAVREARA